MVKSNEPASNDSHTQWYFFRLRSGIVRILKTQHNSRERKSKWKSKTRGPQGGSPLRGRQKSSRLFFGLLISHRKDLGRKIEASKCEVGKVHSFRGFDLFLSLCHMNLLSWSLLSWWMFKICHFIAGKNAASIAAQYHTKLWKDMATRWMFTLVPDVLHTSQPVEMTIFICPYELLCSLSFILNMVFISVATLFYIEYQSLWSLDDQGCHMTHDIKNMDYLHVQWVGSW